jgi:hypothetical protein
MATSGGPSNRAARRRFKVVRDREATSYRLRIGFRHLGLSL